MAVQNEGTIRPPSQDHRSRCICRCCRMCARLSPPRVLLPNTYTQDGWFLKPQCRPARLPRRTIFSRCICRCSRMRARLPLHNTPPPHTGFPMSAHLSRLCLFQRHLRSLVWVGVWVWDWIHSHNRFTLLLARAPLLLATLLSHTRPFPRVH